jgi:RNA polymerase sigma-70 factor (ECF subfamily)
MSHSVAADGEEAQFTRLFEATYREVRSFIERRIGDQATVEDVVFATYLAARRHMDQVPDATTDAVLWLYGVAQARVAHAQRPKRSRYALDERQPRPAVARDGGSVAVSGDTDIIQTALTRLPQDDRWVLMLAAWEGLVGPPLAAVLGCSVSAAATRLSDAQARFADAVRAAEDLGVERGSRDL